MGTWNLIGWSFGIYSFAFILFFFIVPLSLSLTHSISNISSVCLVFFYYLVIFKYIYIHITSICWMLCYLVKRKRSEAEFFFNKKKTQKMLKKWGIFILFLHKWFAQFRGIACFVLFAGSNVEDVPWRFMDLPDGDILSFLLCLPLLLFFFLLLWIYKDFLHQLFWSSSFNSTIKHNATFILLLLFC